MKNNSILNINPNQYKSFLLLALFTLLLPFSSRVFSATFVSGITDPTGIAIHPNERALYVKKGSGGTLWKIPINSSGTAGTLKVITNNFNTTGEIAFDSSGNLFGTSNDANDGYINKVAATGGVCSEQSSNYFSTGIAIESPGFSNNKIFLVEEYYGRYELKYITLSTVDCNGYASNVDIAYTCGSPRFLFYREALAELVGTIDDKLVSINLANGACTTLMSGMITPSGITEDASGNIYVADSAAGEIIKLDPLGNESVILENLQGPSGILFDEVLGRLFIAETSADRITTYPVDKAIAGKVKIKIKNSVGQWVQTITAPSQTTVTNPATCTDSNNNLFVFVTKADGSIYTNRRSSSGQWSTWRLVPGGLSTESAPSAVHKNGRIYLYVRGPDDKIRETIYTISTNKWSSPTVVPGMVSPEGPEAAIDKDGKIYLNIREMR